MATIGITRGGDLPDSSAKSDFHNLVDNSAVALTAGTIATADIENLAVTTAKIANDAVDNTKLDLTGDYALTGIVTLTDGNIPADSGLAIAEGTAPSTAAGEGKLYTKDGGTVPDLYFRTESDGAEVRLTNNGVISGGSIIQVVNVMDGAVDSGSIALPIDDTIPQNTEGNEFMTLAVTPTSATNKLKIDVVCNLAFASSDDRTKPLAMALFQDATANALAATFSRDTSFNVTASGTRVAPLILTYYMDAGTTSETTFKVRAGCNSAETATFNGESAGRIFGGVMASSITITEIAV